MDIWWQKMRLYVLSCFALWNVIFYFAIVPYAGIQALKIRSRPIVEGHFSNHHVEVGRSPNVFATLDFDRPGTQGAVHCRNDHYYTGAPGAADSYLPTAKLAVRDDSCYDFVQMPLSTPHSLLGWCILFLYGCLFSFLVACLVKFGERFPRYGR